MKKKKKTNKRVLKTRLFLIIAVCLLVITGVLSNLFNYYLLYSYIPYNHVLGAHTVRIDSGNSTFYGVGVDMSQLLPGSEKYVVNSKGEDLIDMAARLGINMFRITNAKPAFATSDSTYTKEQWDSVLNKMQSKGIKAVILIESPTIYQKYITSSYLPFVKNYIVNSGVLDHTNVYGVDLYNEPVINSDSNLSQLKKAAHVIKAKYPNTNLTVGWWGVDTFKKDSNNNEIYQWNNNAAGKVLENFTDFYAIHMYGFDKSFLGFYPDPYLFTQGFIANVKNGLQTKKPILIEEFGAGNGEAVSDQDTLGSHELQANTYQGVYQALLDTNDPQILGTTAYQYNSRNNGPDAWAIITNNGDTFLPAAYVLQLYATGNSDVQLTLPFTSIPNDYLLTNADNGNTKTINLNDIVGLKLTLDPSKTYTITTTGDDILSVTQPLTNYWGENNYYATFHATGSGQEQIIFKDNDAKIIFTATFIAN